MRKTQPNGDVTTQSFDALNRAISIEGRAPGSPGALLYRSRYRYGLARERWPDGGESTGLSQLWGSGGGGFAF